MPLEVITFQHPLNVSIQPTDVLYITLHENDQAGKNHNANIDTKPEPYGEVTDVDHNNNEITVQTNGYTPTAKNQTISEQHYLFFSKNREANISGVVGYYAEVEYRNYTRLQAEMFATAANFSESSK